MPTLANQLVQFLMSLFNNPAAAQEFLNDPLYKGFVSQLGDAYATFYVSEADDRQAVIDATDQVILKGVSPADAVKEAQAKVQAMMDKYWAAEK